MKNNVETMLDKAKSDLRVAGKIVKSLNGDEGELCIAAYHLQQALEKTIKHQIEMKGKPYRFTHDFGELLKDFEDIEAEMPSKIKESLYLITSWESKTRYIKGYRVDYNLIMKMIPEISKYLDKIEENDRKANEDTDEGEEKAADSEESAATTTEFLE